jgi:hypothetical protein
MAGFNDLVITTLRKWSPTLADNVTSKSPILSKLKEIGGIVKESGGTMLEEDLDAEENTTFKWYSGYEMLDISATEVFNMALYPWKLCNVNVVLSGEAIRNNKDTKTRKHNLLASKMTNAERTMKNQVAKSIYSDGTANGGKELTGLQLIISDSPATSSLGGIDAATKAFWRNQAYSLSSDGGVSGAATPADMLAAMDAMMLRVVRGSERPNLILASGDFYSLYKQACQVIKRITGGDSTKKIGDASFLALEYEGIPVVYDEYCPDNHMYFVNTEFLKLRYHEDAYFTLDEERLPVNQDAKVYPILFQGNLTCSNRNMQGVITA